MVEGDTYKVTVTSIDRTTSTFTGCTGVSVVDGRLTFTGTKTGTEGPRTWFIVLANVLEYSLQPE